MSVISRNEILGKAVLTVGGTFIGRGREILLDTRTLPPRVAAVLMEGDLDHPGRAVAWDHVRSVGRDAVMVDEVPQTAAQAVPDPAMVALTCDECRLIGKNVVRDDGQVIGRVDDVSFETQSGRLASLHMSSGALSDFFHRLGGSWGARELPVSQIRSIGADAVVVAGTEPAGAPTVPTAPTTPTEPRPV